MSENSNASDSSDKQKSEAAAIAISKQKSLELLFEYTRWHIGVYLTLTAAYLTAAFAHAGETRLLPVNSYFLWIAVVFTMVAGLAGGVIASSLTQWDKGGSSNDFLRSKIGPWSGGLFYYRARSWTHVEHTSFWIGLIAAVLSFTP